MSVNLYLNNKVRERVGFKTKPYRDNSGDEMTFNGAHMFNEKGRLYLVWSEDAAIPDELKDLVEEISCYETIPQMGRRESGIYRHETAVCELTPEDYGNAKREKPMYKLRITAKNLEDIRAIMRKVKTGTIRPEESYEERQGGKTRQQLENELLQTQQQLGEALASTEELREELKLASQSFIDYRKQFNGACEKNVAVRKFVDELVSKKTWVVRGAYIVRQLSQILNGK
jgi:hypothetical protein